VGRLFWKFFFFIFMAQISGIFIMGGTVWLRDLQRRHIEEIDVHPPTAFYIESAAETLKYGGVDALRGLLAKDMHPRIYAVDESRRELLGRQPAAAMLEQARRVLDDTDSPKSKSVREITAGDGHTYMLFALTWQDEMGGPPPPPPGEMFAGGPPDEGPHHPGPLLPMGVSAIASLIFAALLAWHLSKPIRSLRDAFSAVSRGKLDVRPGAEMGSRQDELADLGHGFDHMAAQLQSLMADQRRLLHDVSHELRSPLARMQVAIELAERDPKKVPTCLSRIERENNLINYLIGELLTLSRLGSNAAYSLEEDVAMSDLLPAIAEDAHYEAQAAQRGVKLSGDCLMTVRGSAELLSRAIENVIRNAVRHTAIDSTVLVNAASDPRENTLHIYVDDQGPGVPEANLERIFEPFFQSGHARNHGESHGLGLAITRSVVMAHGGSVRAMNRAEGGMRIDIALPLVSSGAEGGAAG
jgi:two-component system OmpR family sensor kinase